MKLKSRKTLNIYCCITEALGSASTEVTLNDGGRDPLIYSSSPSGSRWWEPTPCTVQTEPREMCLVAADLIKPEFCISGLPICHPPLGKIPCCQKWELGSKRTLTPLKLLWAPKARTRKHQPNNKPPMCCDCCCFHQ